MLKVKNVLNYKKPAFWAIVVTTIAVVVAVGIGLLANPKEELIGKPFGFAGVNAIILEIDKANLSMTVKGTDLNSAIGDKCIIDLKEASLISMATNSEPKSLFLDAFAVGDTVVLFVDEIQETYPTRAKATTIQLAASSGASEPVAEKQKENPIILTKKVAAEFVNQTLSTFKLNSDNTVSFTLPSVIPTDESGKTKLYISSSATFASEPGTSSVQEILDMKDGFQGGEIYTAKLDVSRGKLSPICSSV